MSDDSGRLLDALDQIRGKLIINAGDIAREIEDVVRTVVYDELRLYEEWRENTEGKNRGADLSVERYWHEAK